MSQLTIEEYKNALIDYFEKNLINDPNCCVESIDPEFKTTNKGHGILFRLKNSHAGPLFYVEQMLNSGKTPEESAILINQQIKMMNIPNLNPPPTRLVPDENVIMSAVPIKILPEKYGLDDIEYKKCDDIELYVFLKTRIPNYPIPNAYGHIGKLTDKSTEELNRIFESATNNTLAKARISTSISFASDGKPDLVILTDKNGFADYFYLVFDFILCDIMTERKYKKLYIVPRSPYDAMTFAISESMNETSEKEFYDDIIKQILKMHHSSNQPVPVLSYDINTKSFTKICSEN